MTAKNKNISLSQLCILLLAFFTAMRPILENSIQAKYVENDCIITCVIAGIINLGLALIICYVINKNPGKSFYSIMENFIGKTITKIIMLALAFVFALKILLIDYQMNFLLYDAVYSDIDWVLFTIPICFILAYLSIKGIKTIARTYQIVVPFALTTLLIIFFISAQNANFENLLPLFDHSFGDFSRSLRYILIQSCEFLFLFTFMENIISSDKHYFLKLNITLLITFVVITTFYVLFIAVLGKIAPYVQESLIRMTQFRDNSFGYFKIDIFITVFWLPMIMLQNALYVYSCSYCLNKAINLNQTIASIIIVLLLFFSQFIPSINNQAVTYFFYDQIGMFVLVLVLVLPILLVIASFKKEKNK